MKRIVTLTTDFGIEDHYVGVMKGVMLSINSEIDIVDITHQVASHSIVSAAYIIKNSYNYFQKNTIHVVVVDPGVGSDRKAILVACNKHFFIGPDNGVFSLILNESSDSEVFQLENKKYFLPNISSTFHGRDIFSPVAGHLSNGVSPLEFGEKLNEPYKIQLNECVNNGSEITGEVIYRDKFGNLITNIPSNIVENGSKIFVEDNIINGVTDYYSEVGIGELLAIRGSTGYLEISVNNGSAAEFLDKDKIEIVVSI